MTIDLKCWLVGYLRFDKMKELFLELEWNVEYYIVPFILDINHVTFYNLKLLFDILIKHLDTWLCLYLIRNRLIPSKIDHTIFISIQIIFSCSLKASSYNDNNTKVNIIENLCAEGFMCIILFKSLIIRVIHDFIGETAENRSDYVIHNGKS